MSRPKLSKLRWKRLPDNLYATCFADGCSELTRSYCKRADCSKPFCDKHKGPHIFNAHTASKLLKTAPGLPQIEGFNDLPRERKVELLSLAAKIGRRRDVERSGSEIAEPGVYLAWAVVQGERVERRSNRLEEALQELYVELRGREEVRRAEWRAKHPRR